jgi:rhamnulokinase
VLTAASREANFTNEGGVDATVRYLRNVGGLWLLEQCREVWRAAGDDRDLGDLLTAASEVAAGGPVIDVDDPTFIAPNDMPARVLAAVRRAGADLPDDPVMITRCLLDSLAAAYARTIDRAAELSGRTIDTVHVVGGGAQNQLLCQLTADACGRPVVAGPVEGTAFGNVLVQARAHGVITGGLAALRRRLADSVELTRYAPSR